VDVLAQHADRYMMYYEEPVDWGLHNQVLTTGAHGELGMHSAGYLDGHADYAYRDTRARCGPGWVSINPSWIRYLGSPPPGPIYYGSFQVNCDP
jgi:hypothetical protein